MTGKHSATATVTITRPAYDVAHPAETVYGTGFESGSHTLAGESWVRQAIDLDGSTFTTTPTFVRSGTYAAVAATVKAGAPKPVLPYVVQWRRHFAGLTVGHAYTFTVWVRGQTGAGVATDEARLGIVGLTAVAYTVIDDPWKQLTYKFTATLAAHDLYIEGRETSWATDDRSAFYVDDVTVTHDAWVEHFPAVTASAVPVAVEAVDVTLDDAWAPYGQTSIVIPTPVEADLEFMDPRTTPAPRVTLTLTDGTTSRTFDVALRDRFVNHVDALVTLKAETDEALLMDDAHVATTVDSSAAAYQSSLRALINAKVLAPIGAVLQADAGADADLTVYADQTNLITNPSAEVGTTGWTVNAASLQRSTLATPGMTGGAQFRLTAPTANTSFMAYAGVPVTPGTTYVFGASYFNGQVGTGTASNAARSMLILAGGVEIARTPAGSAALSTAYERLTGEVTIPAGVTSVDVRLYHGHPTSGDSRWDAVKFAAKTSGGDTTYFDGDTPDTAAYRYDWTGTAHASTSTRTNLTGSTRDPAMFDLRPGETLWEFVDALVQSAGLRLFCDEKRLWHLVNPAVFTVAGLVQINAGANATAASDNISRYGEWHDSVVVRYQWNDAAGVTQTRYDVAGAPGTKTAYVEYSSAYPGPGAAAALLRRAKGRGRVLDLAAISDYKTTPGMALQAQLPSSPLQQGEVSAVAWSQPADQMRVTSRGAADLPSSAWVKLAYGETWNASPVGASWVSESV